MQVGGSLKVWEHTRWRESFFFFSFSNKKKALTLVTCPESESERKTGNGTLAPAQSL